MSAAMTFPFASFWYAANLSCGFGTSATRSASRSVSIAWLFVMCVRSVRGSWLLLDVELVTAVRALHLGADDLNLNALGVATFVNDQLPSVVGVLALCHQSSG